MDGRIVKRAKKVVIGERRGVNGQLLSTHSPQWMFRFSIHLASHCE